MAGAPLELVALSKQYGPTAAVDTIDLRVPTDTYCCLLGPSGCGKTTTLRLIAGHETATSGDIILGATNVTDMPPARRGTAMMFQSYALFPHLTAVDNVAFSLKMRGVAKTERRAKAMELLRLVDMAS
jgi:putative spermidine/putrescine transport system ATP-binding protein